MSALEPTPVANPRIWALPPVAKRRLLDPCELFLEMCPIVEYLLKVAMLTMEVKEMLEGIAKEVSERVLSRLKMISDETTQAARDGAVAYASMVGLEAIFEDGELEMIFRDIPFVVLVSDEVRSLDAREFVSPAHGLSPEAEHYFQKLPKYTPVRKYKIYGADGDMKENVFKSIVNDEANNDSAIIEVLANLDGAYNHFTMLPWKHETHITTDSEMNQVIRQRRSRSALWE